MRILEWVAIPLSRWSSLSGDLTHVSCIGRRILYHYATWEVPSLSCTIGHLMLFSNTSFKMFSSDQLFTHVLLFVTPALQHTRLPCPSPTPGAYSNSCWSSWWCHPNVSSSVIPFSSRLQSFPASGSFHWVSSSYQVAKILEFQLQHQSFQWILRTDFL